MDPAITRALGSKCLAGDRDTDSVHLYWFHRYVPEKTGCFLVRRTWRAVMGFHGTVLHTDSTGVQCNPADIRVHIRSIPILLEF